MPTAIVFRDGKAIRTTTLTAAQAADFVILADAVRQAQSVLRNKPELAADGRTLKGATNNSGVPFSERHPSDIYSVLPRIAELLGTHARATWPHLDQAVNGEVQRNPDGSPVRGLPPVHKNVNVPPPFHPAAALAGQAQMLGMTPLDGLAFDYAALADPAPPDAGAPQVRAWVRWRV